MTSAYRSRPVFARFYARVGPVLDGAGVAGHRHRLLEGLAGEVIEVGAGNGLNFAHYPQQVTRVLAVEPEPHLTQARAATPVPRPSPCRSSVAPPSASRPRTAASTPPSPA